MNIEYLESFIEIVKQNSISKATKNLHLTQSALSQQLQALEKSLDAPLLIRSNKGVELTKEGEIVLSYAETFINLYENMKNDIETSKNSECKVIKISSCSSVGEYLIPCTLHLYKGKHSVNFSLKTRHTSDVIEDIMNRTSDVGFTDMDVHDKSLKCVNISSNPLIFICSPKNREIGNSPIKLENIINMHFIMDQKESGLRQTIEDIFKKNGIPLDKLMIEMELDTIESIKASVIANLGVSIVPYSSVKMELYTGVLKSIQVDGFNPKGGIYMIYHEDKTKQEYVNDFIAYMNRYGNETFC